MYSYLYMDQSTYRELLKRARNDLALAVEQRQVLVARLEAMEKEIAQLKRLIGGIYADQTQELGDLLCAGEGLKEAICTALRAASQDVTVSEILGILKELQFPIERHQNPLGSVYTTLTRLMADGEVVAGEPKDEKKTYRWAAQLKLAQFTDSLIRQVKVVPSGDNKKRSR
jgi:uncharacterized coiled-coil protein SlyX